MPQDTPHLEKLTALLANEKLPESDRPRVEHAIERYHAWIKAMSDTIEANAEVCEKLVGLLNEYKLYIDVDLIFDSENDFLYRQKGQVKLDNTIIEEFIPWLMCKPLVPELANDICLGPTTCFSSLQFSEGIDKPVKGGGIKVRSKDQDFAISRPLYLKASHTENFADAAETQTFLAYVAAEIKTNLDKTMFQEASATAADVKRSVAGAKYYLMCEWLDMTPLSTGATDIDEILLLRGAKRLGSGVRKNFSSYAGRQEARDEFLTYLHANPFRVDVFQRFVEHVRAQLNKDAPKADHVLANGFF